MSEISFSKRKRLVERFTVCFCWYFKSMDDFSLATLGRVSLAHLHWLVAVAIQETAYFSEEPVAVATGGGYP